LGIETNSLFFDKFAAYRKIFKVLPIILPADVIDASFFALIINITILMLDKKTDIAIVKE